MRLASSRSRFQFLHALTEENAVLLLLIVVFMSLERGKERGTIGRGNKEQSHLVYPTLFI